MIRFIHYPNWIIKSTRRKRSNKHLCKTILYWK